WRALQILSGNAGSSPSPPQLVEGARFALTPKGQVIRNYRVYYDRVIADARLPWTGRSPQPPLPGDPVNRMLLPAVPGVGLRIDGRDAEWRITEARLAARAYAARAG